MAVISSMGRCALFGTIHKYELGDTEVYMQSGPWQIMLKNQTIMLCS